MKKMTRKISIGCFVLVSCFVMQAGAENYKFGSVSVVSGLAKSEVIINGNVVKNIYGPASISGVYQTKNSDYIFISSEEGEACPTIYRIVDVNSVGYVFTKQFGTCARIKSINQYGDMLKIKFPGFQNDGIVTYFYHGGSSLSQQREEISSPVDTIKISGLATTIKARGTIVNKKHGPVFVFDKKYKFESDDGVIFTDEAQIVTNKIPKNRGYGTFILKIEYPMAGPMIVHIAREN